MEVNFGIEYLHAPAAISTLGGSLAELGQALAELGQAASGGKPPVGLPNKASFVKFESSATLISNLKKSPLFYLSSVSPW